MERALTVGLDGSPESLAAARWAADEAERRKLTLRLLHAWPLLAPEPTRVPSEIDQNYWAKRIVRNARAELQACHPGLTIVGNLVADDAQDALLHAASESEMLVLGSRGLEYVASYFLGDISMAVVARAERPVVLVRAQTRDAGPAPDSGAAGDVVVALKLHGPCDDLLAFAFGAAAARGVPLRVVHGRTVPLHAYVPWGVDHSVTEEITQEAQQHVDQALRPWRAKFPGVAAGGTPPLPERRGGTPTQAHKALGEDITRLESPAKAVVGATADAGLLVVGRRRHHPGVAPRLGPVAQAALHHAQCPVAVVPHD